MSGMVDSEDEELNAPSSSAPISSSQFFASGRAPTSAQASSIAKIQPWVEKYRPKTLSSISSQQEVVATLKQSVKSSSLPHLLFYGAPGTGKTSMILALCKDLWGPSVYKARVLEMNASDERGISAVRNKVKAFASQAVGSTKATTTTGTDGSTTSYPNPPFKIIILDEADTMTPDAQSALRRVIEAYSKVTRFVLICNYVTRIISPLGSRCAKFRFKPLEPSTIVKRLGEIGSAEGCTFENSEETFGRIVELSGGDMRRAVTMLQCAHSLCVNGSKIKTSDVEEMSGEIPKEVSWKFFERITVTGANFSQMQQALEDLMCEGYPGVAILGMLSRFILSDECTLTDISKAQVSIKISECDKCLVDGADELLQLLDVVALLFSCLKLKLKT